MSPKKVSFLIIINALFFAAAIILSSSLLTETPYEQHADTVTYTLIALWVIPNSIMAALSTGEKCRKKLFINK